MNYKEIKKQVRPIVTKCTFYIDSEFTEAIDWLFFEGAAALPAQYDRVHVDGLEYMVNAIKKTYVVNSEFTLLRADFYVSFMRSCAKLGED